MASVTLRSVIKEYGEVRAVHGIDLEIEDGEFMVFVGPSGCAKSTTLRMVAGLEEITGGEILIGDSVINDVAPKDRGIAMVFQNYALYPHKTVYDNMAFGLRMRSMSKDEIKRRVHDAAEKLDITELLERKPKDMSGGQRQRVAVGRAIVRKPDVFLFDEPLSNLDAKLRVSMRVKIAQLHKELKDQGNPATMIYVTHDQTEALTLGDRICVLNAGRIMQVETPEVLYQRPANKFVAGFIGSPSMNFLRTKIEQFGDSFGVRLSPTSKIYLSAHNAALETQKGRPVDFGIRPEHIKIAAQADQENTLSGTLEAVENMGNEKYLHFQVGESLIVARVPDSPLTAGDIGTSVKLKIDVDRAHVFDVDSELNLLLS